MTRSPSGSVERQDGSSPSPAGSIAGTVRASFGSSQLGTDQVLAVGALTLLVAATIVAVGVRLPVAAVALAAGVAGAAAVVVALESRSRAGRSGAQQRGTGRRSTASARRAARPCSTPALSRARVSGSDSPRTRATTGSSSPTATKDSRYLLRQLFPERDVSRPAVSDAVQPRTTSISGSHTTPTHAGCSSSRARRRLGAKRFWRDFPQLQLQVVELDPDVVDVAYRWFALPRSHRLRSTPRTDGDGSRPPPRPVGHDRDRRLLRRLDPVHLATVEFLELARFRLAPAARSSPT